MQQLSVTNIANNLHVQKIIVLFEKKMVGKNFTKQVGVIVGMDLINKALPMYFSEDVE
jgi:hypothetical protein